MDNTETRIAVLETRLEKIEELLRDERKSMADFKKEIYRRLDWIRPVLLVLAMAMVLLHPTVGELLGIIKP